MTLASSLQWLGFAPESDFVLSDVGGLHIAQWLSASPQPTQAEIDAAELPAAKAGRISAINAECRARLVAHYGDALEQGSRWGGAYGVEAHNAIALGVPATIAASNVARDEINAATTAAQVEAVTVTWPVLP